MGNSIAIIARRLQKPRKRRRKTKRDLWERDQWRTMVIITSQPMFLIAWRASELAWDVLCWKHLSSSRTLVVRIVSSSSWKATVKGFKRLVRYNTTEKTWLMVSFAAVHNFILRRDSSYHRAPRKLGCQMAANRYTVSQISQNLLKMSFILCPSHSLTHLLYRICSITAAGNVCHRSSWRTARRRNGVLLQ